MPAVASLLAPPADRGDWVTLTRLASDRSGHSATLLADGSILVAGGKLGRQPVLGLELIYPSRAAARTAGRLPFGLMDHDAVALPDGRVLLAGGSGLDDTCASYPPLTWDPATLAVEPVAGTTDMAGASATLLADGRVLFAGGGSECTWEPSRGLLLLDGHHGSADAVVWDPVDGSVTPTGQLSEARAGHMAVRLDDGRVLVASGNLSDFSLDLVMTQPIVELETWDPASGSWSPAGALDDAPADMVLLADGRVAIAGRLPDDPGLATWDPATNTVTPVDGAPVARDDGSLAVLGDGRVMLVGGHAITPRRDRPLASAAIWDPADDSWSSVKYPRSGADSGQTATVTADGIVLVVGGRDLHDRHSRAIAAVEAWQS